MDNGIRLYGPWGEHPRDSLEDWKFEVANDDTRLGYWAWVATREDHADRQATPPRPH